MVTFRSRAHGVKIAYPSDAAIILKRFEGRRQEHFIALTLDAAHEVISGYVVTLGLANRTIVHPREVFYPAIKDNATAIIVAHNHPSGNCEPSLEDRNVTRRLYDAGRLLGIEVLDSLIVGENGGYYSFLEKGELPSESTTSPPVRTGQ
jgi:DNA repair protein RadC